MPRAIEFSRPELVEQIKSAYESGATQQEIASMTGVGLKAIQGAMRRAKIVTRRYGQKHGHKTSAGSTPTYLSWYSMRQRCLNKNHEHYDRYGGRGITICERWDSFANFLEDMGERPEGLTLDRVHNDGNYTPENCRWSTKQTQAKNRARRTHCIHGHEFTEENTWIEKNGQRHCKTCWKLRTPR